MLMKQFFLSILLLFLPMMASASGYDFTVGGIYYHYDSNTRTASVANRSVLDAGIPEYEGDIVVPAEVT